MREWGANVVRLDAEAALEGFIKGDFVIVQGYLGDILQVRQGKPSVKFFFPKEGIFCSLDNWVIAANSKHKTLAHAFINYTMKPQLAVQNMNYANGDALNVKAREIISHELKEGVLNVIPDNALEKSELIRNLGADNSKYMKIWNDL